MHEAPGSGSGERDQTGTPSGGASSKVSRRLRPGKRAYVENPKLTTPGGGRRKGKRIKYSDLLDAPLKVTVGKSGRVTLPASVRDELELDEGTELNVQVEEGELVLTPVVTVPRFYRWAYSPEHLDRLDRALADADEGRIRPLDEDELTRVLRG